MLYCKCKGTNIILITKQETKKKPWHTEKPTNNLSRNCKKPDDHHQVARLQRFMQGGLRPRGGHPTALRLLLGCLLPAQRVELSVPRRTGKALQIHRHRPRGGTPPRTAGNSQRHTRHLPLQLGQGAQDLPRLQPLHHSAVPRLRLSQGKDEARTCGG